jgi:hypothetical protein
MKHLAFILSFYILSTTVAPTVKLMYAKYSSEHCGKSCSQSPVSDTDGCQKDCCSIFSCLKTLLLFPSQYKISTFFQAESWIKNNFILKRIFVSLLLFDIWHPPKFV